MGSINLFLLCCLSFFSTAQPKPRLSVSGSAVTGTYRFGPNLFKLQALGKGRLKVHFYGQYKGRTPESVNVGEREGIAIMQADSAVFRPNDTDSQCVMRFKFLRGNRLAVKQQPADSAPCGLGNNVNATGTYRKVSNRKPDFTAGRPL